MSSTIRKVLGYGLTDVQASDPRINWNSPLLDFNVVPWTISALGLSAVVLGLVLAFDVSGPTRAYAEMLKDG
jgi:hypothetical protein